MAAPSTLLEARTNPAAGQPVEYPYSDGKVLMETDPHARSIIDMRDQLETHFKARQDVYVAGSLAVYYRRGDPTAVVVPDVFVVLGAAHKEMRKSYLLWEERGVVPSFVVEVASTSTSRRDATSKRATYQRLGVREYWRFDPLGELIAGRLEGWQLAGGRYERVRAVRAGGWHRSEALGLELRAERRLLRFHAPQLGRAMLTHSETSEALQATASQRDAAVRERDEANRRIHELEARLRLSDKAA
jgi:Uma2 family endonuclease